MLITITFMPSRHIQILLTGIQGFMPDLVSVSDMVAMEDTVGITVWDMVTRIGIHGIIPTIHIIRLISTIRRDMVIALRSTDLVIRQTTITTDHAKVCLQQEGYRQPEVSASQARVQQLQIQLRGTLLLQQQQDI